MVKVRQSKTLQAIKAGKFDQIAATVGNRVGDLLDRPGIVMLKKLVDPTLIEMFLAAEIQKLVDTVNVAPNQNIQQYQIPVIAATFVEMYPVESLEDFVLCFRRGGAGFYGVIYNRLDAAVLNEWMKKYLDEKYQIIEADIKKAQDQSLKDNEVNYEKFKERVSEFVAEGKPKSNAIENEIQRKKLANPYKWYNVRGIEIMATSQAHAEKLIQDAIKSGDIVEVENENTENI